MCCRNGPTIAVPVPSSPCVFFASAKWHCVTDVRQTGQSNGSQLWRPAVSLTMRSRWFRLPFFKVDTRLSVTGESWALHCSLGLPDHVQDRHESVSDSQLISKAISRQTPLSTDEYTLQLWKLMWKLCPNVSSYSEENCSVREDRNSRLAGREECRCLKVRTADG